MTLKNSFWASLTENNKRRIWLWILSFLGFVLASPTVVAISLSVGKRKTYLIDTMGEELGRQAIINGMIQQMEGWFGVENPFLWLGITCIAVISGISGFGYLYSRRKLDFYMGMPVKRSRRFFIIWLNGILIFLLPYLAGTLLGFLIAAGNGVMTASVFLKTMNAILIYSCFYLGVYHLAVLAVMMTGNLVITCLGVLVFFLYEVAVRWIIVEYKQMFFKLYAYKEEPVSIITSPFARLFDYDGERELATAVPMLLLAAVAGGLAYICYLKRPAEAAGKAMAFKQSEPVIKILLVVPMTLLAGDIISGAVGYSPMFGYGNPGLVIFVMVMVAVISCCLIQVLYESDIKAILHKKRHILISGAVTAAIFLVFRFDLMGYDTYIPKAEEVSSTAFIPPFEHGYYGGDNFFDDEMEIISKESYMIDNMYLTDAGVVNKLLKNSIDTIEKYDNLEELYKQEEGNWYSAIVLYRMNSRRNVYRKLLINVNDAETISLLDKIESSDEYIGSAYLGTSENLVRALDSETEKVSVSYGTNVYQNRLTVQETKELLALYKEDMRKSSFTRLRESVPMGGLKFSFERKRKESYTSYYDMEVKIYPFMTGCVDYLKERGYYMDRHFDPEDVEKITVLCYNGAIAEEWEKQQKAEEILTDALAGTEPAMPAGWTKEAKEYSDFHCYASYDDAEQIAALSECLYSEWAGGGSWHSGNSFDYDYYVAVHFKEDSDIAMTVYENTYTERFRFLEGEVPEFVQRDTAYVFEQ